MKIIKDKKGIALESAILFMIVIFFLCFSLVTLALMGHSQAKYENGALIRRVELDGIGEDFLRSVQSGEDFSISDGKYDYIATDTNDLYTLNVKTKSSETTVLYVEARKEGEDLKLLCWRYSYPTTQTE